MSFSLLYLIAAYHVLQPVPLAALNQAFASVGPVQPVESIDSNALNQIFAWGGTPPGVRARGPRGGWAGHGSTGLGTARAGC